MAGTVGTASAIGAKRRDSHRHGGDVPTATWDGPVGGPVRVAWREGTLTRAKEIESLTGWLSRHDRKVRSESIEDLERAIKHHLEAAREAAGVNKGGRAGRLRPLRNGSRLERAISNLDAAEALLLNFAPPDYLLGQVPSLLNHVQRHLVPTDPRRLEFERVVKRLGLEDRSEGSAGRLEEMKREVTEQRGRIVSAVRGASSEALREQLRVRSFRNVLVATTVVLTLLAVLVAVIGLVSPTTIPLCFEPESSGQTVVVCPTQQSSLVQTDDGAGGPAAPDVDDAVKQTASRADLLVVEMVGLTAAAVAAAAAIRGIRGSSEPHGLPVALAVLKLPTGAITAFLGLLLMRGQFLPGLTALDTSAQILAWALVFGYAQQLFTRLVDQQAHTVLNSVRAPSSKSSEPASVLSA